MIRLFLLLLAIASIVGGGISNSIELLVSGMIGLALMMTFGHLLSPVRSDGKHSKL